MPKVRKRHELPPPEPTLDLDSMTPRERAAFAAGITNDPLTWRLNGRIVPSVPWFVRDLRPFFTAQEMMQANRFTRPLFNEFFYSGRIPGNHLTFTNARQKHEQPVIDRVTYVRHVILNGLTWLYSGDASQDPKEGPQPRRRSAPKVRKPRNMSGNRLFNLREFDHGLPSHIEIGRDGKVSLVMELTPEKP